MGAFSLTKKGWWKAIVSSFSLMSSSLEETDDSSPSASFFDRCLQKSVNSSTDLPLNIKLIIYQTINNVYSYILSKI